MQKSYLKAHSFNIPPLNTFGHSLLHKIGQGGGIDEKIAVNLTLNLIISRNSK